MKAIMDDCDVYFKVTFRHSGTMCLGRMDLEPDFNASE